MVVVPTMCIIDGLSFPTDSAYLQHMQTVHGTNHPDAAMKQNRSVKANIPAEIPNGVPLPPGVRPEDLPSPEFMETVKAIESAPPIASLPKLDLSKSPVPVTPKTDNSMIPTKKEEPKPLKLQYVWSGNHSCGSTVKTIMIEAGGELWCSAYCLSCEETVGQIHVHPIAQQTTPPTETPDVKKPVGRPKKEVQNGQ